MSGDPRQSRFDVALQIRAVTALATRQPDTGFLAAAAGHWTSRPIRLASRR